MALHFQADDGYLEGPTVLEQRSSVRRFTCLGSLADAGGAYLCCMTRPHLPVVMQSSEAFEFRCIQMQKMVDNGIW
jgi:hypothetical protein